MVPIEIGQEASVTDTGDSITYHTNTTIASLLTA